MADHVHIEGLGAYNGDHPLDVTYFTNRELHLLKQLSGVRPAEIEEAFQKRDNDLIVTLAAVALQRGGHVVDLDVLWDAKAGLILLVLEEEEEADAGPPSPPPSEPGETSGDGERATSSGGSSRPDGDPLENGRSRTGTQVSATGAASVPETLAS